MKLFWEVELPFEEEYKKAGMVQAVSRKKLQSLGKERNQQ